MSGSASEAGRRQTTKWGMRLTAVYILLGVLALIAVLLLIPLHVRACYDGELRVRARYAFVSVWLYPRSEKPEKPPKKGKPGKPGKKKKAEKSKFSEIEQLLKEEGVAAAADYLAEMAKLTGRAVRKALAAVTVDSLRLKIRVVSGEAASTAVEYGKVCAAVYPAEGFLESLMHVKRRTLDIQPDFLGKSGEVKGNVRLHVIPFRILCIAVQFFIGYIGNTMAHRSQEN